MEEEEWQIENGKVSLFAFWPQPTSSRGLPTASPKSPSGTRTPVWLWPHVLSLEAPAVAMLWLAALARVNDLRLMPGVLPGLGLAVWLIYLMDRVLDTCGVPVQALSMRHQFYRRFRWPLLLGVIPAGLAVLAWLGLWVVPAGLLGHSLAQVLPIGLYLVLYSVKGSHARRWILQGGMLLLLLFVNMLPVPMGVRLAVSLLIAGVTLLAVSMRWHERIDQLFRKEVAAGLLFALGCTTWTRFHILGSDGPEIWMEPILLGLLFVSNLALITVREALPGEVGGSTQGTARSAILISSLALVAIHYEWLSSSLLPLTCAVLGGSIGLEILWQKGRRMSAEAFRVWADVVVALPALVLLLLPDSTLA